MYCANVPKNMFKYILRIKEATDEQLLLQISQKDKKKTITELSTE